RLRIPDVQLDRRPHRLRERRAAADLPQAEHASEAQAGRSCLGARGEAPPRQPFPWAALRWAAAEGRGGAGGRWGAAAALGGRTAWEPRLHEWRDGDVPAVPRVS